MGKISGGKETAARLARQGSWKFPMSRFVPSCKGTQREEQAELAHLQRMAEMAGVPLDVLRPKAKS
jgi:hypothetical protein